MISAVADFAYFSNILKIVHVLNTNQIIMIFYLDSRWYVS
jgi:hypothetical protein